MFLKSLHLAGVISCSLASTGLCPPSAIQPGLNEFWAKTLQNPPLSASSVACPISIYMRSDDAKIRGRRITRPDTPQIVAERERQRIRYHARDLVDQWMLTTLSNCRSRARLRVIRAGRRSRDRGALWPPPTSPRTKSTAVSVTGRMTRYMAR